MTMPNHNEVAHAWAHKLSKARKGFNMYHSDGVIYSYGSHFPIAAHVENGRGHQAVLFTTKSYSISTSKHKEYTRRACSHLNVLEVENVRPCGVADHASNYEGLITEARGLLTKAKRARTNGPWLVERAQEALTTANDYSAFYDLGLPAVSLETVDATAAAIVERVKAQEAEAAIARIKAKRAQALRDRERLCAWIAGADVSPPHTFRPMCRVKGDTVETTWGARVPLAAALDLWRQLKICKAQRLTLTNPGQHVGDFGVDQIAPHGLRVGCHFIPYRFAKLAAERAGLVDA